MPLKKVCIQFIKNLSFIVQKKKKLKETNFLIFYQMYLVYGYFIILRGY